MASLGILPGRSPRRPGRLRWGWGGKGALGKNQPPLSLGVHGRAPRGAPVCSPSMSQVHPPAPPLYMCGISHIHSFTECVLVPSRARPWDDARRQESLQL